MPGTRAHLHPGSEQAGNPLDNGQPKPDAAGSIGGAGCAPELLENTTQVLRIDAGPGIAQPAPATARHGAGPQAESSRHRRISGHCWRLAIPSRAVRHRYAPPRRAVPRAKRRSTPFPATEPYSRARRSSIGRQAMMRRVRMVGTAVETRDIEQRAEQAVQRDQRELYPAQGFGVARIEFRRRHRFDARIAAFSGWRRS